jgi:hypothetical protein
VAELSVLAASSRGPPSAGGAFEDPCELLEQPTTTTVTKARV